MHSQTQDPAFAFPAVELVAKGIIDPVLRLKFLKYMARYTMPLPVPADQPRPRPFSFLRLAVILALLVGLFAGVFMVRAGSRVKTPPTPTAPIEPVAVPLTPPREPSPVWQVETTGAYETYSNGLRIDSRFAVSNHPRAYRVFPADEPENQRGSPGSRPAGIVFHTTESRQVPFEEQQNLVLQRIGESLLEYVQRRRAYNYLIDRFGRVYRIVAESDAADHAGYSVWANEHSVYLNLNESFLGVSFEAETQPGQVQPSVSTAQVRSAAMLTEMLRGRYAIPAANCVTHAQVSVNPSNMRVGFHTDWASSFPFEQLGLPNNYARPSPAMAIFGFEHDSIFLHWAGTPLYSGVEKAEAELKESARRSGLSVPAYRDVLQKRYRQRLAATRQGVGASEAGVTG